MEPTIQLVVAAVTLAGAAFFLRHRHSREALLFGAWLFIDGLHGIAHGGPALTPDPGSAQAIANAFHIPSFFGFIVGGLLVSRFTGIHLRAWRDRRLLAALLAVPVAFTLAELALPSPFWVATPDGVHIVGGPLSAWSDLGDGLLHAFFDVYFIAVVAWALARRDDVAEVPGHALLLGFLLIREVPAMVQYATNPVRWAFLDLAGMAPPPLLPADPVVAAALAVAFAALPLAVLRRARVPAAWEAGAGAVALAAVVSGVVQLSAPGSVGLGRAGLLFGALLLAYAALRHGVLGARRIAPGWLELPLAASGSGLLLLLFVAALRGILGDAFAVALGLVLAMVCTALLLSISGIGVSFRGGIEDRAALRLAAPGEGARIGGRYRVGARLGGSPQAGAFAAVDEATGERVVLKRIPPGEADAASLGREAAALRAVVHPNVVVLRDVVEDTSGTYLATEYVPGGDLAARIAAGGALAPADFRRLATTLLEGLAAVHAAGIVHRDLKPQNVLLGEGCAAKLADFHIARVPDLDATVGLSHHGPPPGTLRYMSPEQAAGQPADAASDRYGAAATLFEAATGTPLVEALPGESLAGLRYRVAAGHRAEIPQDLPQGLQTWLGRALARDPRARFASTPAMLAGLRAALPAGSGGSSGAGPSLEPATGAAPA